MRAKTKPGARLKSDKQEMTYEGRGNGILVAR